MDVKQPKEIDGIFQADNPLPEWWKWILLISIIFAVFYAFYFPVSGWDRETAFKADVAAHEQLFPPPKVLTSADGSNPLRDDKAAIAEGEKIFSGICAACHKADATGLVGPSLVDNEWIHGSTDAELFNVIMEGVAPENTKLGRGAMPAHKNSLGQEKVYQILAWLATKNPDLKKLK